MVQITPPIALAQKILGRQRIDAGAPCRLTGHCVRVERPEGALLYHTLTGELVLLSHEEEKQLDGLPCPVPPALGELAARWFLRPLEADDIALADQIRDTARLFSKKDNTLTEYLIFTTTACNARCFYCFEAGMQRMTMTEETARAAGEYIANHCGGQPVHLVWFGGEPLVNVKAIDTICSVLRERDVAFRSRMVSNGYLLDEGLASRAKGDWGLYLVQITLDGTEEIYNRRKAYVSPQGSPFQRVLRNIGLLLDAGVQVVVRLNMDGDNKKDLYALTDGLLERFAGRDGFGIYCRVLIENKGEIPSGYTEDEHRSLAEKAQDMWAYLYEKGVAVKRPLKRQLVLYSCRSDDAHAASITPEGRLGRCESHIDKGLWGSVFSDGRDEQALQQWRERRPPEEVCRICALYPRCVRLKNCVIRTERCSPIERAETELELRQGVLEAYEDWRAGQPARTETV